MFASSLKRRVIVDSFQYRLLAGNLLYLASLVLVFFVALFGPVMIALTDTALSFGERNDAARQLLVLNERVRFAFPVLVALCVAHSILVSHRIAAPLHRLKSAIASLAGGDLTQEPGVRDRGCLGEEAELLAGMVGNTRARLQSIEHEHSRAERTAARLCRNLNAARDPDASVLAEELTDSLQRMGERLREFEFERDEPLLDSDSADVDRPLAMS